MQIRILKKKVQQIDGLEMRGAALDPQQLAKIAAKPLLESALALLEQGTPLPEVQALLAAAKEGTVFWHRHMCLAVYQKHSHKGSYPQQVAFLMIQVQSPSVSCAT